MNETFLCRIVGKKGKIYKILFHENDGISCPVRHSAQSLPQSRCFKIGTINVRNLYEKNRAELKEEQEAKGVLLPFRERKAEAMPEAAGRCYNSYYFEG